MTAISCVQGALGVNTSLFAFSFVVFNFLSNATTPLVAAALSSGDKKQVGAMSRCSRPQPSHPALMHMHGGNLSALPLLVNVAPLLAICTPMCMCRRAG